MGFSWGATLDGGLRRSPLPPKHMYKPISGTTCASFLSSRHLIESDVHTSHQYVINGSMSIQLLHVAMKSP